VEIGPQGPANGPNGRRKRPQNPKNGVFRVRAGNFEGLFSVALARTGQANSGWVYVMDVVTAVPVL
ncbi:hypothetical protein NFX52_28490, partial [Acidovorax facilis]|uniref:hypothetical protein n=1 Tax=Acidovorax facilis TaxID=12917 RepID=UPI00208F97BF